MCEYKLKTEVYSNMNKCIGGNLNRGHISVKAKAAAYTNMNKWSRINQSKKRSEYTIGSQWIDISHGKSMY